MTWTTTLNKIRYHSPCKSGWEKLLRHLGKTAPDDEPLALSVVLGSNGLDDALWCLRAIEGKDKEIRLFAVWCARQVEHLMTDPRSKAALDTAERFANGQATREGLNAAREAAAWAAASDAAAWAASDAGRTAAHAAGRAAAWAAHAAGRAAAWAAHAAGRAAGRAAAWAASDAAGAAASDATRAAQLSHFRTLISQ